jgi:hypothetical protein
VKLHIRAIAESPPLEPSLKSGRSWQFRADSAASKAVNCRPCAFEKIACERVTQIHAVVCRDRLLRPADAGALARAVVGCACAGRCAESAENAATKEAKATQLAECGVKFAGRRKPGGGYTYFDFMQNRHFDIAGPNPTPEEQEHLDEQYAAYLARERQSAIAAAFAQKQQQLQRAAPEAERKSAVPLCQKQ